MPWIVTTEGESPDENEHREHDTSAAAWTDCWGRILELPDPGSPYRSGAHGTPANSREMARLAVRWDGWIGTSFGKKLDSKLDKMRSRRVMRHPAAWITRGSDAWFGLAAALTNAITTVAAAHLLAGKPVSSRRVLIASASFAVFVAGLGSLLGVLLRDAIAPSETRSATTS